MDAFYNHQYVKAAFHELALMRAGIAEIKNVRNASVVDWGGYYEGTNGGSGLSPSEIGKSLTDPYVQGYDPSDPNFHDYAIGASLACLVSSQCTVANVAKIVNAQSVPFSFNPPEGEKRILGSQPIVHFSPTPTISINQTLKGHWFHPGRVVHTTFQHNGGVWFYTRGVGVGPDPAANMAIGYAFFGKMHNDVFEMSQWLLVGNPPGR